MRTKARTLERPRLDEDVVPFTEYRRTLNACFARTSRTARANHFLRAVPFRIRQHLFKCRRIRMYVRYYRVFHRLLPLLVADSTT